MAIALTTDPIISEQDAKELLSLNSSGTNSILTRMLINSVSKKFLTFTGRTHINETADVVLTRRGDDSDVIWLKAYASAATTVEFLNGGDADTTLTFADGDFTVHPDAPKIVLHDYDTPASCGEENVRVTYTAGWSTVPGDIVEAAVEQLMYQRERVGGRGLGVDTESRSDHSVTYEIGNLLKSVKDAWLPYMVMY